MLDKPSLLWPAIWREDILQLSETFSTYQEHLNKENNSQQERQSELYPADKL